MGGSSALLAAVLRILLPVQDILDGRVEACEPPPWCSRRGWDGFLLGLDEGELGRCEAEGLDARAADLPGAPPDLVALALAVGAVTRLPSLQQGPHAETALRAVSARKRRQLPALLGAVTAMADHAARIVDVGAGSGHFTMLAADLFAREAVGLERNPERVAAAVARARELGASAGQARFVSVDACREGLAFARDDLAVGLHACGELGDRLVVAAASARCDVALVSCCLQKISGPSRAPLSRAAAGLTLRRETLGLANLTSRSRGVETSLEATIAAREARHALHRLLAARGAVAEVGEEMRGINRRRAHAGLAALARQALALRGLAPASDEEIRRHEEEARGHYAQIRRLSLPRNMLARLMEIAVVLDRAAALEESGLTVRVVTLFDGAVSPRNIGLFASREAERLPGGAG